MFQQLVPLLRQRPVLLTATAVEKRPDRVNVLPKRLVAGENAVLTPDELHGNAAMPNGRCRPSAIELLSESFYALQRRASPGITVSYLRSAPQGEPSLPSRWRTRSFSRLW